MERALDDGEAELHCALHLVLVERDEIVERALAAEPAGQAERRPLVLPALDVA